MCQNLVSCSMLNILFSPPWLYYISSGLVLKKTRILCLVDDRTSVDWRWLAPVRQAPLSRCVGALNRKRRHRRRKRSRMGWRGTSCEGKKTNKQTLFFAFTSLLVAAMPARRNKGHASYRWCLSKFLIHTLPLHFSSKTLDTSNTLDAVKPTKYISLCAKAS